MSSTESASREATRRSDAEQFQRFKAGEDIGFSEWLTVTQQMIDRFGEATLDPDPMHIDPVWAKSEGPYGGTIAFGFLTASLLTYLLRSTMAWDAERSHASHGYYMNYGFDRMRLVSPVPVGCRVRGRFRVLDVRAPDEAGRVVVKIDAVVEVEGQDRPAAVAEWLTVWIPPGQ